MSIDLLLQSSILEQRLMNLLDLDLIYIILYVTQQLPGHRFATEITATSSLLAVFIFGNMSQASPTDQEKHDAQIQDVMQHCGCTKERAITLLQVWHSVLDSNPQLICEVAEWE